ncbi:MAG TPA: hypothetical protein VFB12_11815 [Ktedonobacteraceae bacterium]|nr:hypothetical protein [Ktedonobacteraceae bacterium]
MHSTDNIFVKTTDRPHFRMLKRMTVIFPICLIICLSMSALASAHVRQQVSPNDTVTKVLSGTATAWSDNALLPGPSSQSVTITLTIDTAAGTCTYTFPPTQFTDPSTGVTVTVTTEPGTATTCQYTASTGVLTLNGTLELQNVPLIGTVDTQPSNLSTENTATAADGTSLAGKRVDASNNVTLVGTSSFSSIVGTTNLQMQIVGTLN